MQNFIVSILIKVLSDPKVQQTIKNLLSELITEKIAPLVPLAAASAAHAFANLIPGVPAAIEDVVAVANTVRDDLNKLIPDVDIGIPLIDDIIDAWRPRN
jgi:TctA family transporter